MDEDQAVHILNLGEGGWERAFEGWKNGLSTTGVTTHEFSDIQWW